MTKLGLVSGWCSSMRSWSPERVRAPLASTVGADWDRAGFRSVEVPGSATNANRDRPMWLAHKAQRSGSTPALLRICCAEVGSYV
jgi:hypothetical protein